MKRRAARNRGGRGGFFDDRGASATGACDFHASGDAYHAVIAVSNKENGIGDGSVVTKLGDDKPARGGGIGQRTIELVPDAEILQRQHVRLRGIGSKRASPLPGNDSKNGKVPGSLLVAGYRDGRAIPCATRKESYISRRAGQARERFELGSNRISRSAACRLVKKKLAFLANAQSTGALVARYFL